MSVNLTPFGHPLFIACAFVAGFIFGSAYFSPIGVSRVWVQERIKSGTPINPNKSPKWIQAMIAQVVAVLLTDLVLARIGVVGAPAGALEGAKLGGAAASALALAYAFTNNTTGLMLLDCAFPVLLFTLYGAVIGLGRS